MRLLPEAVKRFGDSCTEEPTIALPLSRLIEPRIIRGYVRDWILAKLLLPDLQITEWTGLYSLLQDLTAIFPSVRYSINLIRSRLGKCNFLDNWLYRF